MLAPMQGLTNRALRALFIKWSRPDVVFSEFVRVRPGSKKSISDSDRLEITGHGGEVPLVIQLIGRDLAALVTAAQTVQDLGVVHLNINMGCPYGRMTSNSAGGALLKAPAELPGTLKALRQVINGTFSVKLRAGYEDPQQVLRLLPFFEESGVDYLILHPRTVQQRFDGLADHGVTRAVVAAASIPVIANGDIFDAPYGREVLNKTKAAGLMLGRGAISDPFLFERLRGRRPATPTRQERAMELRTYLQELRNRYQEIFCGDAQILCRLKEVVCHIHDPCFATSIRALKRARRMVEFEELIGAID